VLTEEIQQLAQLTAARRARRRVLGHGSAARNEPFDATGPAYEAKIHDLSRIGDPAAGGIRNRPRRCRGTYEDHARLARRGDYGVELRGNPDGDASRPA
jgi:hypothetical protein